MKKQVQKKPLGSFSRPAKKGKRKIHTAEGWMLLRKKELLTKRK